MSIPAGSFFHVSGAILFIQSNPKILRAFNSDQQISVYGGAGDN
jgi:hypothetical protein